MLLFHAGRYQNGTKTDQLYEVAADLEQPTTLAMGACGEVKRENCISGVPSQFRGSAEKGSLVYLRGVFMYAWFPSVGRKCCSERLEQVR